MTKKEARRQLATLREGQYVSVSYLIGPRRKRRILARVTAEGSRRHNRFVLVSVTTSRHGVGSNWYRGGILTLADVLEFGGNIERIEPRPGR